MTSQLFLVVNPAAGRGRAAAVLRRAVAVLDAAGARYQVRESAGLQDARDLAAGAARAGEVVVAVGGDGTVGALAGVVAKAAGTLGILPAGRGNDFARMLGIPAEPAAAAAVLVGGQMRQADLIGVVVPGRDEIIVAGCVYLGVPSVAGELANASRWLRGPMAYPVSALRALARWQPATFRVECAPGTSGPWTDRAFAGYAVVAANSAYFGAGMLVAPQARTDDGLLDLVLMEHGPKLAFVRALMKIRNGSHLGLRQVSTELCAQARITTSRDMPAAADGETLPGAAPLPAGHALLIRVRPAMLSVLAPAARHPA